MTQTAEPRLTRTGPAGPAGPLGHVGPTGGSADAEPLHVDTSLAAPFVERHIGPSPGDIEAMLQVVGQPTLDALVDAAVPSSIRAQRALRLDAAPSEAAVVRELRGLANRNSVMRSMIGLGYYGTITPPVVQRNVLENPAWYTAYTPYQPEISQGRLEALLNFQTVVSDLTGLPIAGASLLDESTAVAEAMTLMRRTGRAAADAVLLVDAHTLPQSVAVTQTRAVPLGIQVVVADFASVDSPETLRAAAGDRDVFGVVVQYPGADGELRDFRAVTSAAHEHGALVTAAADLLALTLVTAPGEWGADIAVGNTQRFGVPMAFGGPHAGYMAVRAGLERSTARGASSGVSLDSRGTLRRIGLSLQAREQHIRREKATSNICTAQVLLAVMASPCTRCTTARHGLKPRSRERVNGYVRRDCSPGCAWGASTWSPRRSSTPLSCPCAGRDQADDRPACRRHGPKHQRAVGSTAHTLALSVAFDETSSRGMDLARRLDLRSPCSASSRCQLEGHRSRSGRGRMPLRTSRATTSRTRSSTSHRSGDKR